MTRIILIVLFMYLSGCSRPYESPEIPETKYPETPTMGAWEPLEE